MSYGLGFDYAKVDYEFYDIDMNLIMQRFTMVTD